MWRIRENLSQNITLDELRQFVEGDAAAFRGRSVLEPAGGPGDKVFPPSHSVGDNEKRAGAKYAFETRRSGEPEALRWLESVESAPDLDVDIDVDERVGRREAHSVFVPVNDVTLVGDPEAEVRKASENLAELVGSEETNEVKVCRSTMPEEPGERREEACDVSRIPAGSSKKPK